MDVFRVIVASAIFCISSYLVYDLLTHGFNWLVLLACLLGYVMVHYILPKRATEDSQWYELLEIALELPYRTMALCLRSLSSVFRKTDIDLDL